MTERRNPVDRLIGDNIARAMTSAGISIERLAAVLDVRKEILREWIAGEQRVGAARLFDVCCALRVPVAFMYEPGQQVSLRSVREASPPKRGS